MKQISRTSPTTSPKPMETNWRASSGSLCPEILFSVRVVLISCAVRLTFVGLPFGACHVEAKLLTVMLFGSNSPTIWPSYNHETAVGNIHHLIQLKADEENRLPVVAALRSADDECIQSRLHPVRASAVRHTRSSSSLSISRATIAFCWLPRRHAARRCNRALSAADIVLAGSAVRRFRYFILREESTVLKPGCQER